MQGLEKRIKEVKDTPRWMKVAVSLSVLIVGVSQVSGLTLRDFFGPTEKIHSVGSVGNIASTTIPVSEVLSKINEQRTFVEQRDLFEKYIGTAVDGNGKVINIDRGGEKFLVDIHIRTGLQTQLVTCLIGGNEREILLLKNKKVEFRGTFDGSSIFNHGLGMGDCLINW